MAVTVLVGVQWGDEGKGKLIDVLTRDVDMVVRFQGGNNAGHTVQFGNEKFVVHLVPSGVFRPGVLCVIGNGVVLDPVVLRSEILELSSRGVDVGGRLQISSRCHLIMPYHRRLDSMWEGGLDNARRIGTTRRGIGPAYADKAYRRGLRAMDMLDLRAMEASFRAMASYYNDVFTRHGAETLDIDAEWLRVAEASAALAPLVADTSVTVNRAVSQGRNILFEGAQGMLLDVDFGTYPFVTSSNTTAGGACTGSGVSPKHIDSVTGVMKAYCTRVGEGPFPTEVLDADGERLRAVGGEYGATTGRPRRCGWFDAVAARYSCMINGVDTLAVTKLDVLDGFDQIKVCTAYEIDGRTTDEFPPDSRVLARARPVYSSCRGWRAPISSARSMADLPPPAAEYLRLLETLTGARIGVVSVGPHRDQTFSCPA